jgi:hypothetical protein
MPQLEWFAGMAINLLKYLGHILEAAAVRLRRLRFAA